MQVSKFESLNVNCPGNNLLLKGPKRCECFWTCQKQEGRREAKKQGKKKEDVRDRKKQKVGELEEIEFWKKWVQSLADAENSQNFH